MHVELIANATREETECDAQICLFFETPSMSLPRQSSKEGRRFPRAKLLGIHQCRIAAVAEIRTMLACRMKAAIVVYEIAIKRRVAAFGK